MDRLEAIRLITPMIAHLQVEADHLRAKGFNAMAATAQNKHDALQMAVEALEG